MTLGAAAFQTERHDLLTAAIASPGAGNTWSIVPAGNHVIQVVSFSCLLTTSVAVANRVVRSQINHAVGNTHFSLSSVVQDASNAWEYFFTMGIGPLDQTADANAVQVPLPCCCQLKAGDELAVEVYNFQGTDAFTNIRYRYFDWLEA